MYLCFAIVVFVVVCVCVCGGGGGGDNTSLIPCGKLGCPYWLMYMCVCGGGGGGGGVACLLTVAYLINVNIEFVTILA